VLGVLLNPLKKIVLLIGSPKGNGGTSASIGNFILSKLQKDEVTLETYHVGNTVRKEEKWDELAEAFDDADIILLSFPLYWDSLPSHLMNALERLNAHRKGIESKNRQKFYVVVNNGFPEPWHNEVAITICHNFAKEAGFKWQGALNIGGGGAINEKPLEETGGMTFRLRETLEMAAAAIGKGETIPEEVEARLGKPLYPSWIIPLGNLSWRSQARKKSIKGSISARPYKRQ